MSQIPNVTMSKNENLKSDEKELIADITVINTIIWYFQNKFVTLQKILKLQTNPQK